MRCYDKTSIESTINFAVDVIFDRILYCVNNKINKYYFDETQRQLKYNKDIISFVEKSGEEYFAHYSISWFFPDSKLDKIRASATATSTLNSICTPVGARWKFRKASLSDAVIEIRVPIDSIKKYFEIRNRQKEQEEASHDANIAIEIEKISNIVSALANSSFLTDMAREIDVVTLSKHAIDSALVADHRTGIIQIYISNRNIQWKDSICERLVDFESKGYRRLSSQSEVLAVCKALCDYMVHSIEAQGDMRIQHREKYYYYPDPNSDIAARASFIITVISPPKEPLKDIF